MAYLNKNQLLDIAEKISPHVHRTPLLRSSALSRLTGHQVYLKAELFQKTGSYKPRGMINALSALTAEERGRGVITASAGNAAQGLAYAANLLGVKATVTMPAAASPIKAEATRGYGAEVILHGNARECFAHSLRLAEERGLTFIQSYNNIPLMQGYATLGLEIIEELPVADAILVGVGGGGMLGGITMAAQACRSTTELIGVEPTGAPAMYKSFAEGKPVELDQVSTIADGLAPPSAGPLCYEVVRPRVREIALVSDDDIVAAMLLLMQRCKLYVEPSGAAGLAGLLTSAVTLPPNSTVVCVLSGGNLDPGRLKALLP